MANLKVHVLLLIAVFFLRMETSAIAPQIASPFQPGERFLQKRNDNSRWSGKPRIINGQQAYLGQFPYQVFLTIERRHYWFYRKRIKCGGSLLSDRWILTAAHCTKKMTRIRVYLGTTNIESDPHKMGMSVRVSADVYDHPANLWFFGWFLFVKYDASLLKLGKPVKFTTNLKPIRLPSSDSGDFVGKYVTASGWGVQSDGKPSKELQWVRLRVISNEECEKYFGYEPRYTNMCAKGESTESVCTGDSGLVTPRLK